MQTRIPCVWMRGGTSKGAYFRAEDLPDDPGLRDRILLAVMGSPDARQIDGMGGSDPLTSKVAIVGPSSVPGVDIDYLFAQVVVDQPVVDVTPNCGNMLAGVAPFALEEGMIPIEDGETVVRIRMVNSDSIADATIQTPGGHVEYAGDARIDGCPGTAAPVVLSFLDTEGSVCGSLLPTGKIVDVIDGIEVTCIDNGMPCVIFRASDLGRTGYESRDDLNNDTELKAKIESIRLQAGHLMGVGDVTDKVFPKMTLVAPPQAGGTICTRSFIPKVCHAAIGVLAAVSVGTACVLPGSPAYAVAKLPEGKAKRMSVEHPTGEFTVEIETDGNEAAPKIVRSALLRTTRRLFEGNVLVPGAVWDGRMRQAEAAE